MGFWWVFLLICLLVGPPTPCKTLSHINMCIYKVFLHLGMLWMGIWVHPWANIAPKVGILLAKLGFWWIFLLFCLVLGPRNPLRLHPTSISYVCKCFSTLICHAWACADTPPKSTRVNFQEFWGGGRPIWCGYIMVEPRIPLGVLHKSISYIYKVFLHLDKLWMGIWHHP
jgi:hypothetical protein